MSSITASEARNVSHRYGRKRALEHITFTIRAGTITGLVGANGSGKSTLLRLLAGVQHPTSGRITQFGEDLAASERAGEGVGAAIDGMALWPQWTVARNLRYLARLSGDPLVEVERALRDVSMEGTAQMRVRTLSLGNRQRAAIAAAVLVGTRIVLLDEPMNGLDPDARQLTRDLIIRLSAEGRTVVLSSHDLNEVESLCSEVIVLREGALAFAGPPERFRGTTSMKVLRVSAEHVEAAQQLMNAQGIHCRREPQGDLVVFSHDARAAQRSLGRHGIKTLESTSRPATLEERFHEAK